MTIAFAKNFDDCKLYMKTHRLYLRENEKDKSSSVYSGAWARTEYVSCVGMWEGTAHKRPAED